MMVGILLENLVLRIMEARMPRQRELGAILAQVAGVAMRDKVGQAAVGGGHHEEPRQGLHAEKTLWKYAGPGGGALVSAPIRHLSSF